MSAAAGAIGPEPSAAVETPAPVDRLLAPALPTVWPSMLVPRPLRPPMPWPFSDPGARYFYFARNGVFAIVGELGLSGAEVLMPAYCHGVELEALVAAGAVPIFYPVGRDMRVDPDDVARLVSSRTRAVYLIHYVGFPGPARELRHLCNRHGLRLIEDCALALLSAEDGVPLGRTGDAAVFCLYKTIGVPNGGAIVVPGRVQSVAASGEAPPFATLVRQVGGSLLRNVEMRGIAAPLVRAGRAAVQRLIGGAGRGVATGSQTFDAAHQRLAMSRLSRRVIKAQDFVAIVERRRRNYLRLRTLLADAGPEPAPDLAPGVCPLFYPLRVGDGDRIGRDVCAAGVETIPFWSHRPSGIPEGAFPEADDLRRTVLWVPCHQDLEPDAITWIAQAIRCAIARGPRSEGE